MIDMITHWEPDDIDDNKNSWLDEFWHLTEINTKLKEWFSNEYGTTKAQPITRQLEYSANHKPY